MAGDYSDDLQALFSFIVEGVDDRTFAILHVSYIERYLARAITLRLPGLSPKLEKSLLAPDGHLGALAAKNDLARALDVITDLDLHNLKLLGSIRNQFAHNVLIHSFDHIEISTRVNKLKARAGCELEGRRFTQTSRTTFGWAFGEFEDLDTKGKFDDVATGFNINLHNFINSHAARQEASPEK